MFIYFSLHELDASPAQQHLIHDTQPSQTHTSNTRKKNKKKTSVVRT